MALFSPQPGDRSWRSEYCLTASVVICLGACASDSSATTRSADVITDAGASRGETGVSVTVAWDAAGILQPAADAAVGSFPMDGGLLLSPLPDSNCTVETLTLLPRPAEILLLLDRSTTMAEAIAPEGTSKWSATVSAIASAVQASQDGTAWGLMLFPKDSGDTACCQMPANDLSPVAEVAPERQSTSAVSATLAQSVPSGTGAPTARALVQASNYLVARGTSTSKYIVLASGAEPTCASDGVCSAASTADYARTKDTVAHVASVLGIPVAVAGIALPPTSNLYQPDGRLQLFSDLANLGGMPNTAKGQAAYYAAGSTAELAAVLGTLNAQMTSCSFALPGPIAWPDSVVVLLSGTRITQDTSRQNGWDYADRGTSVVLFGKPCNDVRTMAGNASLSFVAACPAAAIY
jgi:hypothetical protein